MEIYFVIGPPGAGKSRVVANIPYWQGRQVKLIDPDLFKQVQGEEDHEASIEKAKKAYQEALKDGNIQVIVYQGSGSWYPYMRWLFDQASPSDSQNVNIRISLVFVHANLSTCVTRAIQRREETGQDVASSLVEKRHRQTWDTLPSLRQDPRVNWFIQINTNNTVPQLEEVQPRRIANPSLLLEENDNANNRQKKKSKLRLPSE